MDLLLSMRRMLEPIVGRIGLRPIAQLIYRPLLRLRYGPDGLARVRQNGREWKYHLEVALRGESAEIDTIQWLRRIVRRGDCVLDIGANVGQMALEAGVLTGPEGKVIAIEPAPGNLQLLSDHIVANGMADRIDVVAAACGANHGVQVTLRVAGADANTIGSGHSIVGPCGGEPTTEIPVPMVSVDGLCRDRSLSPAVLKIDVEGAELEVLMGAVETLVRCQPHVLLGFHPFAFPDPVAATSDLREILAGCGYDTPPPTPSGAYELGEYVCTPPIPLANHKGDGEF